MDNIKKIVSELSLFLCIYFLTFPVYPATAEQRFGQRFTKHIYDRSWYKRHFGFYLCQQNITLLINLNRNILFADVSYKNPKN